MTASPELPTVRWISEARFNRHVSGADFDHHYGGLWGPRHDQRLSLRLAAGATAGVLYAYDPLWDEYAVLQPGAAQIDVEAAFARIVKWNGPAGVDVSELAQHLETVTRASEPCSDQRDVPLHYELTPAGREALDAPLARSVNRTATYVRNNPPPPPLAPSIDGSATRREIEL
jgi:hypothetical protein